MPAARLPAPRAVEANNSKRITFVDASETTLRVRLVLQETRRIGKEELPKKKRRCIFSAWEIASKNLARSREADGKLKMCSARGREKEKGRENGGEIIWPSVYTPDLSVRRGVRRIRTIEKENRKEKKNRDPTEKWEINFFFMSPFRGEEQDSFLPFLFFFETLFFFSPAAVLLECDASCWR